MTFWPGTGPSPVPITDERQLAETKQCSNLGTLIHADQQASVVLPSQALLSSCKALPFLSLASSPVLHEMWLRFISQPKHRAQLTAQAGRTTSYMDANCSKDHARRDTAKSVVKCRAHASTPKPKQHIDDTTRLVPCFAMMSQKRPGTSQHLGYRMSFRLPCKDVQLFDVLNSGSVQYEGCRWLWRTSKHSHSRHLG